SGSSPAATGSSDGTHTTARASAGLHRRSVRAAHIPASTARRSQFSFPEKYGTNRTRKMSPGIAMSTTSLGVDSLRFMTPRYVVLGAHFAFRGKDHPCGVRARVE